ncbi:MAG: hypothetical protein KDJ16_00875 [Hyphomicrobiales bacterium]|nr:hypothetical protein [Hyphomicrobiales bacterium]
MRVPFLTATFFLVFATLPLAAEIGIAEPPLPAPKPDPNQPEEIHLDDAALPGINLPLYVTIEHAEGDAPTGDDTRHSPGAVRRVLVTVRSGAIEPITGIDLQVRVSNGRITLAPEGAAVAGGMHWRIDRLEPREGRRFPIAVRLDQNRTAAPLITSTVLTAQISAGFWTHEVRTGWPVSNCAIAYHAALQPLREGPLEDLRAAVKASKKADRKLPGKRIFGISGKGRDEAERKAIRFADAAARRRGIDSELSSADAQWYLQRMVWDLREYLGQPKNPMLCTGAVGVVSFLDNYADRVRARGDDVEAALATALETANAGIASAWTMLGEAAGAARPQLESPEDIGSAIAALAAAATRPGAKIRAGATKDGEQAQNADKADTGGEPVPVEAFDAARKMLSTRGGVVDPQLRETLAAALAEIETYYYLVVAQARVNAIRTPLDAILDGIDGAHASSCGCYQ